MKYMGLLWSIPLIIVVLVLGSLLIFSYATLEIEIEDIITFPKQLTFEVFHDKNYIPIIVREDPDRYSVKLYEYHDKVDAARTRIFKTK